MIMSFDTYPFGSQNLFCDLTHIVAHDTKSVIYIYICWRILKYRLLRYPFTRYKTNHGLLHIWFRVLLYWHDTQSTIVFEPYRFRWYQKCYRQSNTAKSLHQGRDNPTLRMRPSFHRPFSLRETIRFISASLFHIKGTKILWRTFTIFHRTGFHWWLKICFEILAALTV